MDQPSVRRELSDIAARNMGAFFAPRSIAVVGASQDETKFGGRPVQLLRRHGFPGAIYPVNTAAAEVQGLRAYPSVAALPEAPDLAVIAVPAEAALGAVEACAERGVRAAVILSSGFSEAGEAGLAAQHRLVEAAGRTGLRLLGPNCLGSVGVPERAIATFSIVIEQALPPAGPAAIVSQSGNVGSFAMQLAVDRGLGIGRFIATGNECDVDAADAVAWLAGDPATRIILCCLETCRSAAKLTAALAAARSAGKPVLVLKIGTSDVGQAAAASHTGALAGSDAVFGAVFERYGAIRVHGLEEMIDLGHAASILPAERLPRGPRLALVTGSGGFGVMMADAAAAHGLEVPALAPATQARILAAVPAAAARNPVDATAQLSSRPAILKDVLSAAMADDGVDATVLLLTSSLHLPRLRAVYVEALGALRRDHPDRLLAVCAKGPPDALAELGGLGIPCFETIDATCAALARLAALGTARPPLPPAIPVEAGPPLPPGALRHEAGAKAALAAAGLPVPPEALAADEEAAARAAAAIGYPVVLKVASPDIPHKTEVGGVAVDLGDEAALRAAHRALLARVRAAAPRAAIDGVIVAPMAKGGVELIVGTKRDPIFGPVVMAGLGGVFAEVFRDVAVRLAPVDAAEAEAMLRSLKAFPLLDGARGRPPADLGAAAEAIAALSRFAMQHAADVDAIDVNPLLIRPKGEGAAVLDALIVGAPRDRSP